MTKEEQIKIGRNIRKMREVRGYDQKHMASQLGIQQNTYSKLENAESKITEERLEKIAEALNTTVAAIKHSDVEKMVFNFNHQNQQGNSFGYINIYNAADEIMKAFAQYVQPMKNRINSLEEKIDELQKQIKK